MIEVCIKNMKLFEVLDEKAGQIITAAGRSGTALVEAHVGCGPTTVANIMSYLNRCNAGSDIELATLSKCDFQELMVDVWNMSHPVCRGYHQQRRS
jgi:hypothetical protein